MKKLGILLMLSLCFSGVGHAQNASLHTIEATFIANFFRYIQLPNVSAGSEFVVGVYAKDHEITALLKEKLGSQKYFGATVIVKNISEVSEVVQCNMVFIPKGKSSVLSKVSGDLAKKPILVITEEAGGVPNESVINFKVVDSKLTFSVNKQNADSKNIQISSKLLAIAS